VAAKVNLVGAKICNARISEMSDRPFLTPASSARSKDSTRKDLQYLPGSSLCQGRILGESAGGYEDNEELLQHV